LQGAAISSKIKNKKQKFKQAIQKLNILFLLRTKFMMTHKFDEFRRIA